MDFPGLGRMGGGDKADLKKYFFMHRELRKGNGGGRWGVME